MTTVSLYEDDHLLFIKVETPEFAYVLPGVEESDYLFHTEAEWLWEDPNIRESVRHPVGEFDLNRMRLIATFDGTRVRVVAYPGPEGSWYLFGYGVVPRPENYTLDELTSLANPPLVYQPRPRV